MMSPTEGDDIVAKSEPMALDPDVRRAYVSQLVLAGRLPDALDLLSGVTRGRCTWFEVRQRHGEVAEFVSDVWRVWRADDSLSTAAVCAAVLASVRSQPVEPLVEVVGLIVEAGVWNVVDATYLVRAIDSTAFRTKALCRLLPQLEGGMKRDARAEVFEALPHGWEVSAAEAKLLAENCGEQVRSLIQAVAALPSVHLRVDALLRVGRHLDRDDAGEVAAAVKRNLVAKRRDAGFADFLHTEAAALSWAFPESAQDVLRRWVVQTVVRAALLLDETDWTAEIELARSCAEEVQDHRVSMECRLLMSCVTGRGGSPDTSGVDEDGLGRAVERVLHFCHRWGLPVPRDVFRQLGDRTAALARRRIRCVLEGDARDQALEEFVQQTAWSEETLSVFDENVLEAVSPRLSPRQAEFIAVRTHERLRSRVFPHVLGRLGEPERWSAFQAVLADLVPPREQLAMFEDVVPLQGASHDARLRHHRAEFSVAGSPSWDWLSRLPPSQRTRYLRELVAQRRASDAFEFVLLDGGAVRAGLLERCSVGVEALEAVSSFSRRATGVALLAVDDHVLAEQAVDEMFPFSAWSAETSRFLKGLLEPEALHRVIGTCLADAIGFVPECLVDLLGGGVEGRAEDPPEPTKLPTSVISGARLARLLPAELRPSLFRDLLRCADALPRDDRTRALCELVSSLPDQSDGLEIDALFGAIHRIENQSFQAEAWAAVLRNVEGGTASVIAERLLQSAEALACEHCRAQMRGWLSTAARGEAGMQATASIPLIDTSLGIHTATFSLLASRPAEAFTANVKLLLKAGATADRSFVVQTLAIALLLFDRAGEAEPHEFGDWYPRLRAARATWS